MRKLMVYNQVSLDGFIADAQGDMSWAHKQDPEWNEYVAGNAGGESEMLYGRITYEMMVKWWPTPQARVAMPAVAEAMNKAPKVVFSRSLKEATWANTRLVKTDPAAEVRSMKNQAGPLLLLMGSGTIVSLLAGAGLVDEFTLIVNPVALGRGTPLFAGLSARLNLRRSSTRAFGNGNVLLSYERAA